ncbi:MAG: hypothetical protein U5L96_14120 [Owenweeksia sp.]|nr:hypothetical protein [Owenweeksia sp.]
MCRWPGHWTTGKPGLWQQVMAMATGMCPTAFGGRKLTDKGNNWADIGQNNAFGIGTFPAFYWAYCRKILIHPTNENILFAAFRHGVYRTTNALAADPANVSWTRVLDQNVYGGGFFDIQFKPGTNGNVVVVSGKKVGHFA